jgi:hypothetical protein
MEIEAEQALLMDDIMSFLLLFHKIEESSSVTYIFSRKNVNEVHIFFSLVCIVNYFESIILSFCVRNKRSLTMLELSKTIGK